MQKRETEIKFLAKWKEVLTGSFLALACLALFYFFPSRGPVQDLSRLLFFLLIIPALYIKLILKKSFRDFGLTFSVTRENAGWLAGMLLLSLLIAYFLIEFTSFKRAYLLPSYALGSFWWFLVYELVFVNIWLFLHESFYRGFIFFTFAEKFGSLAILVAAFSFAIFLGLTRSFSWIMAPYVIISLTGGWLTYKTRSFVYSYLMGLLFIIILDAYIVYAFKQLV
ncbi:MAG: hypothetical protein AAB487_00170 [Patescibacteria group bacterium]